MSYDPDRLAEIGEAFKDDPIGYAVLKQYWIIWQGGQQDNAYYAASTMLHVAVKAFMSDKFPDETSAKSVRLVGEYVQDERTLS